jgi:hypothetical protein
MSPSVTTNQTDKAIAVKAFHRSSENKSIYEANFHSKFRQIHKIITRQFSVYSPHVIPHETTNGNLEEYQQKKTGKVRRHKF